MKIKSHIYFVPGLAASSTIFENLDLPKEKFEIHYLDWLVPLSLNESITEYAKRMCKKVLHKNPILIGVSFGGVMVQEIGKFISAKKIVIISSVKSTNELPKRLRVAKATKAYKLIPTKVVTNIEEFAKYTFSDTIKKRVDLYRKYISMRDENYLPWAIHTIINWQEEEANPAIIHIHGNDDSIFPIKHIKKCIIIDGGTHVMILNKAKEISKILIEVI